MPAPDYDSNDVNLTPQQPLVPLQHGLGSMNLLVDMKVRVPSDLKEQIARASGITGLNTTLDWRVGEIPPQLGFATYGLPDENHIVLGGMLLTELAGGAGIAAIGRGQLRDFWVRARIWKYPEK